MLMSKFRNRKHILPSHDTKSEFVLRKNVVGKKKKKKEKNLHTNVVLATNTPTLKLNWGS